MEKIIFVYDIFTPYGRFPNGLNPKYFEMIFGEYNMRFDSSLEGFLNQNKNWPVYCPALNTNLSEYRSINDLKEGKIKDKCYYAIEPWGSLDYAFGLNQENEPFTTYMSGVAKDLIREGRLYLVINFSDEGGITQYHLKKLKNLCNQEKFPEKNVFFIHADFEFEKKMPEEFSIKNIYYPYSLKNKSSEIYNKIEFPDWQYWNKETHPNWFINNYSVVTYEDFINCIGKKREYKGLYLNRRFRPHRILLYKKLFEDGLLNDNLLYSYDLKMFYNISHFENNPEYLKFIEFLKLNNPKYIDVNNFDIIQGYGFEVKETYLKTYFSIVTETMFEEENGYISEKTWKPIAQFHPFILFGRPYTLSKLKELGFKTFDQWWDEGYDVIENNEERFNKVYSQIKKIQSLSHDELIKMIDDMKEILIHNNELFLKYGKNANIISENVIKKIKKFSETTLI